MRDPPHKDSGGKEQGSNRQNVPEWKPKTDPRTQIETLRKASRTSGMRGTAISRMVNPHDVLDKLLDIEVTGVTAREIIGVSCDLSTALADLTKVKGMPVIPATPTVQVHHARDSIDQRALLELPVVIGNNTYMAIIDSGSQVNIIRDDLYRNDIKDQK